MAYENKLDNSDVQLSKDNKDVVGGLYNSMNEAQAMKVYLETLKLTAELQASTGKIKMRVQVPHADPTKRALGEMEDKEVGVDVSALIPKESEFERTRKVIISKINQKTDNELRELMARFDSDSTWELSSKIANYVLDQRKRTKAFNEWNELK